MMKFESSTQLLPLSPTKKTSRAALALNNTGVSLLERGCFKESLHTFTDSMEIMKLVLVVFETAEVAKTTTESPTTTISCQGADYLTAVDQTLNKASKRIAVCWQKKKKMINSQQQLSFSKDDDIHTTEQPTEISCLDDDDVGLLKAAGSYASSSAIAFPIRLRDNNTASSDDDDECLDLQASVISYNHGLACLLAYEHQQRREQQQGIKVSSSSSLSNTLLAGAFKFFSFAHAMMIQYLKARHGVEQQQQQQKQGSSSSSSSQEQQHEKLRALLIIRLILGKLFQVIRYQRRAQRQIQGVLDSLVLLDDAVSRLEKTMLGGSSITFRNSTSSNSCTHLFVCTIAPAA